MSGVRIWFEFVLGNDRWDDLTEWEEVAATSKMKNSDVLLIATDLRLTLTAGEWYSLQLLC
jgi:hypothetical protein